MTSELLTAGQSPLEKSVTFLAEADQGQTGYAVRALKLANRHRSEIPVQINALWASLAEGSIGDAADLAKRLSRLGAPKHETAMPLFALAVAVDDEDTADRLLVALSQDTSADAAALRGGYWLNRGEADRAELELQQADISTCRASVVSPVIFAAHRASGGLYTNRKVLALSSGAFSTMGISYLWGLDLPLQIPGGIGAMAAGLVLRWRSGGREFGPIVTSLLAVEPPAYQTSAHNEERNLLIAFTAVLTVGLILITMIYL